MGIVNVTPDSFFGDSRINNIKQLLQKVECMLYEGADFIDIGAFSTRPGSSEITEEEELKRLLPSVKAIRKAFPECFLSVDTFRASIADASLSEGTDIINDIGGLTLDTAMLDVVAKHKSAYVLMHGVNALNTMHSSNDNIDLFRDICAFFSEKLTLLNDRAITEVLLDPGFGFGKTLEQNFELLQQLELFHLFEQPMLMGISRKSMIYKKLNTTPDDALNGTTALNTLGLMKGISVFRVHDVKPMNEIIKLLTHEHDTQNSA
jgi:dihydropteroate synthase